MSTKQRPVKGIYQFRKVEHGSRPTRTLCMISDRVFLTVLLTIMLGMLSMDAVATRLRRERLRDVAGRLVRHGSLLARR